MTVHGARQPYGYSYVVLNSFPQHARKGLVSFLFLMLIFFIHLLLNSMHAFNLISFHQIQPHKDFRWACEAFFTSLSFPLRISVAQTKGSRNVLSNSHLWFEHLELVEDVLLHAGVGGGSQGHHGHGAELPAQRVQPLVVLSEVMAPLGAKHNSRATQ